MHSAQHENIVKSKKKGDLTMKTYNPIVRVICANSINSVLSYSRNILIMDRFTQIPIARIAAIGENTYLCYLYDYEYKEKVENYLYKHAVTSAKTFADNLVWVDNFNPNYACYRQEAA